MAGLNELSGYLNGLVKNYKTNTGKDPNGADLLKSMSKWDYGHSDFLFDGTVETGQGKSIDQQRTIYNGNDILFGEMNDPNQQNNYGFQSALNDKFIHYNTQTGAIEELTTKDLASVFDKFDDNVVNGSVTKDMAAVGQTVAGSGIWDHNTVTFNTYKLVDTDVKTQDKPDKTLTLSSADVKNIMSAITGSDNVADFAQLKRDYRYKDLDTKKPIKPIEDYLIKNFGGSINAVLKNLTDTDIQPLPGGGFLQTEYLNAQRQKALDKIAYQIFDNITGSYANGVSITDGKVDGSVPNGKVEGYEMYSGPQKNSGLTSFVDKIHAITMDFTSESKIVLNPSQLDGDQGFIDFLSKKGIKVGTAPKDVYADPKLNAPANKVTVSPDGNVKLNGRSYQDTRPGNQTPNSIGYDLKSLSLGPATVEDLLNKATNAKKTSGDEKSVIKDFLLKQFASLKDYGYGSSPEETAIRAFLGKNQDLSKMDKNKVLDSISNTLLQKLKSASSHSYQKVGEVSTDIATYKNIAISKDDLKL